jgi:long-chain fatty acid transport protein
MQTKRPIIKSIYTAVACLLSPALLWAGGFQVNLQGQKQTAMGHCGIALPLDNSAIVFNPGTLIFVDSLGSFSAGAAFTSIPTAPTAHKP